MPAATDQVSLGLDVDPAIDVTYIHIETEEKLIVGAVGHPSTANDSESDGFVVCHHPEKEPRRALPLIWTYREFLEAFRRADGVGETVELF